MIGGRDAALGALLVALVLSCGRQGISSVPDTVPPPVADTHGPPRDSLLLDAESLAIVQAESAYVAQRAEGRRSVRISANPVPDWFYAHRSLDLSGDGVADELVIRAIGSRGDSLKLRLEVLIQGKRLELADWESEDEMMDTPFPRGAPMEAVDSFVRGRLIDILGNVTVRIERVTPDHMAMNPEDDCHDKEDAASCLRQYWGLDRINGRDVAVEITSAPVPLVTYAYAYESVVTVAWVPSIKRFVGVAACC